MLFAAVHESADDTKRTQQPISRMSAIGGKAGVKRFSPALSKVDNALCAPILAARI